jgi:putative transposase
VLSKHGVAIVPSTFYKWLACPITLAQLEEAYLVNHIVDLYRRNKCVYGVRKMWRAARRAGLRLGRDQVGRLMRIAGIQGVRRGVHHTRTTTRDERAPRHPDLVKRGWKTPNRPDAIWVADFTYVWTGCGFVYTSFITDVYSRRILGWKTSSSKTADLVTGALQQALATRRRASSEFTANGLIRHSNAGSPSTPRWRSPKNSPRRDRRIDRYRRRRTRQRVHGIDHRPVQDRSDPSVLEHAELERSPGGGTRDRRVGTLVQQ